MTKRCAYNIIVEKSLILECYVGSYNVDELIEFKKLVGQDIYYNSNYSIIHDLREIVFEFGIKEIKKYVDLLMVDDHLNGKRKLAFITSTPNQVTITTGFDILKKELEIDIEICSTLKAAFKYVRLPKTVWESVELQLNQLKNYDC